MLLVHLPNVVVLDWEHHLKGTTDIDLTMTWDQLDPPWHNVLGSSSHAFFEQGSHPAAGVLRQHRVLLLKP